MEPNITVSCILSAFFWPYSTTGQQVMSPHEWCVMVGCPYQPCFGVILAKESWKLPKFAFKVKNWYILPKSKKSSPDFTYMVLCSVKNLNLQKKISKCWGHLHFLGVNCLIKLKQLFKIKFFEKNYFLLADTSVSKKR